MQYFSRTLTALMLVGSVGIALPAHAQTKTTKAKANSSKKQIAKPTAATAPAAVSGDYIVAIVNREPVTNREVNLQANALAQAIREAKQPVPAREALLKQALDTLVLQKAALHSARNSGITVSEGELQQIEVNMAHAAGLSLAEYRKKRMTEDRLTENQYFSTLRDAVTLERVRDARVSSEVARVSDQEAMKSLADEQRRNGGQPLVLPEFRARHILVLVNNQTNEAQAMAKLTALRKQIAAGKLDFSEAARTNSQDGSAQAGGDLGWFDAEKMVPEFSEQIARMQPGQLSQPFMSRFGAHLVVLDEVRAIPMNARQQLALARNQLRQQRSALALQQWENELRNSAYIEMRGAPR